MKLTRKIRKLLTGARKRGRKSAADARYRKLLDAGIRLMADQPFDRISVRQITAEIDCSVGAFYKRFSSKEAFLATIIEFSMQAAIKRAQTDLSLDGQKEAPLNKLISDIIIHIVTTLCASAGVVRAIIARAGIDSSRVEPISRYRAYVTDRAEGMLANKKVNSAAIPMGLQITFGATCDRLLRDGAEQVAADRGFIDALSSAMASVVKSVHART